MPLGSLPNNELVRFVDVGSGYRLHFFCRSDSMVENVGVLIGLDGNTTVGNTSFFEIANPQAGELTVFNMVGSQSATLPSSEQGVYTCRIPDSTSTMRDINVGIYGAAFNSELQHELWMNIVCILQLVHVRVSLNY